MGEHEDLVIQDIKKELEKNKLVGLHERSHEPLSLRVSKLRDKRMQLIIKLIVWTIVFELVSATLDLWANHSDLSGPISFVGGASTIFGFLSLVCICLALGQLYRARAGYIRKEIRENELL